MAGSGPSLLAEGYRLTEISPRAFQHPADRAATAALGSIPYLDTVVRKLKTGDDVVFEVIDPRRPDNGINVLGGTLE